MAFQIIKHFCVPLAAKEPCIVVRGGASHLSLNYDKVMSALELIAKESYKLLKLKLPSTDAVEETIKFLEENPIFNCGCQSILNDPRNGQVENHASIMEGKNMKFGCVSSIDSSKHPISVARAIMERSLGSCFLVGTSALRFAEKCRVPTVHGRRMFLDISNACKKTLDTKCDCPVGELGKPSDADGCEQVDWKKCHGGVGVVAMDEYGNMAAGASCSALVGKTEAGISGEHLIGSGVYAKNTKGAVSVSGNCSQLISLCAACRLMKAKDQSAAWNILQYFSHFSDDAFGAIYINREGRIGVYTLKGQMPWYVIKGSGIRCGDYLPGCYSGFT
ncbi:unnamed protein product [Hermetia illucens]|uniref:Uncharacterized protein n=1 Tax=Hermetia illucens TaxID=343691 RepID=A0A7R8UXK8_HERIL|nr:isoaspartyl peptidase/L-asparaginase-like [Hermetia illucens]CAD7088431.1 unnamed protein product [Hermetia illucens]